MNLHIGHFVFMAILVLAGVVFANTLRGLPLISSLPQM
jgi:hypothetical protein